MRYLDWVRSLSGQSGLSLYDSSVSPPNELLAKAVGKTFQKGAEATVPAVFGGGSQAMHALLSTFYSVDVAQIVATSGVSSGLNLVFRALARPGDHVLVEQPGYQPFEDIARAAGLRVEGFARKGPAMRPDLADIQARIRPETRMIVLSHLHNPTGLPLLAADFAALTSLCEGAGILLVVDEIYGAFMDDHALAAAQSAAVISLSGLSKIFGLGALRCGWIVAEPALAEKLRQASVHIDSGMSAVSHAIALTVMQDWSSFRERTQDILDTNRMILSEWLEKLVSSGLVTCNLSPLGCLAFPRLTGMPQTEGFAAWLLATRGIVVAPGKYWGAPQHIRLGFGTARGRLEQGLAALALGLRDYAALPPAQRQVVNVFSP